MTLSVFQKISLLLLRLALGSIMFFYAGIMKVLNPAWSAEGYLKSAKTFPALYQWFASFDILPITNFVNEWGVNAPRPRAHSRYRGKSCVSFWHRSYGALLFSDFGFSLPQSALAYRG